MSTEQTQDTHVEKPRLSITSVEQETLDFIRKFIAEHGYAPSVKDMCGEFKVTSTAVLGRLNRLERKGFIMRSTRLARAIRVTDVGAAS